MTTKPRVSVLTPIYNTNPVYLREMIESVLTQTFTDFEFLILNDSPDNTEIEKIVKSFKDKRIKYLKNNKNIGISNSRNKLLQMANGEYLAIFDHDDISEPTRLEKQVAYLDANPNVGVVSSWVEKFGDKNFIYKTPESDILIKMFLTENNYVMHTAAMIRKSVLVDNDIKYEPEYFPAEDYRLWERLMNKTSFHNIQEVLVKYRLDRTMTSVQKKQEMAIMHDKVSYEIRNMFPAYHIEYMKHFDNHTHMRVRLFGIIPLFKLKNNKIYLFEFIPIAKLRWK